MTLEGATTVGSLMERLISAHPGLVTMKGSIRFSVNREVVAFSAALKDGDEVGVLPPIAGG